MTAIDAEIERVAAKIEDLVAQSKHLIEENTHSVHDQEEYKTRHAVLVEQYNQTSEHLKCLQDERNSRIDRQKSIEWFRESFSRHDGLLEEFDEEIFFSVLDSMIIYKDERVIIRFRDGTEAITERHMPRNKAE